MPYFTILAAVWSLYRVLWCILSDKKRIFWIHSVSGLPASFLCIHFSAKNRMVCTNTLTSHRWDVKLYSSFLFWKVQRISNPTKKNSSKLVALLKRYRAVKLAHFFPATVRPMGASDWPKVSAYAVTSVRANHSAWNHRPSRNQGVKTCFFMT